VQTAVDIVIAPLEALKRLRATPTWGWAFLIVFLLMVVGYFLQQPAAEHAAIGTMQHALATSPLYGNLSEEQKARILARVQNPPAYQTALGIAGLIVAIFLATLFNATILLVGNALGRGSGTFARLFAGSMNIAIPTIGIYYVVLGIICRAFGADHFTTTLDVIRAVPGLAAFAPGATGKLGFFLANIQVFALWGVGLNIAMMRVLAQIRNAVAWVFPILILILAALTASGAATLFGG
jgi:hypothetical protein